MSELKACPFCGTNKIEIEVEGNFSWGECHVCGATSEAHRQYSDFNIEQRKEGASEKWNTRPIEDALRSEVTKLTDQRRWHQYTEGDKSTYPPFEDWYLVTNENDDLLQEYFSFEVGWKTNKNIIGWAYQPEPVESEGE